MLQRWFVAKAERAANSAAQERWRQQHGTLLNDERLQEQLVHFDVLCRQAQARYRQCVEEGVAADAASWSSVAYSWSVEDRWTSWGRERCQDAEVQCRRAKRSFAAIHKHRHRANEAANRGFFEIVADEIACALEEMDEFEDTGHTEFRPSAHS